jgi:hypothetical protein
MKYKIIEHNYDLGDTNDLSVRDFTLEDEEGNKFYNVDIFTDGELIEPDGVSETRETWRGWLDTFVGKAIEVELTPRAYFTSGKITFIN